MSLVDIIEMIDEWNSGSYNNHAFEMFAITYDERIVGYISLYERSKSIASVGVEVIGEERNKGLATKAVSILLQYASKKQYRVILDQVQKENSASIRLHEKLGFETDGYVYRNQRDHEVFVYLKPLQEGQNYQ